MNLKNTSVYLLAAWMLAACAGSGLQKTENGVIIEVSRQRPADVRKVRLEVMGEKLIRVSATPEKWNKTSPLSFINMPILSYSDEIRSAVLMLHGEKAHSRYFSEDAFKKLQGDNKELLIIPGANHVDLYDNIEVIPFGKIERFFNEHLR